MKNFLNKLLVTFSSDIKQIVISVLLAIVVWFAISLQIFPDIVSHIDNIEVKVTPTDYMTENNLRITEDYAKSVSVQISGKRYYIGNLSDKDFYASLDLSNVKSAGEQIVKIDVEPLNDVDCTILSENLTATIKVEKTISKTFSVDDGNFEATADDVNPVDNFKIDSITAEPSQITLTGDEKLISSIKNVEIKSLFAGDADASIQSKGEIVLYNEAGEKVTDPDISMDNDNFNVSVSLYKQKTLPLTVQFTNVPENFDLASLKYSIYPDELTISSPDSSIDDLEKFEVGTIDLSQLTTKYLQRLTLPITLPDGYKNHSGNYTAMVTFAADDYISLNFTVPKKNITVSNVPDSFDVSVITNEISVNVVGPSAELLQLTSADIYATANLIGTTISEGSKDISVAFRLRGTNVNSWVTGEYKITIQATEKDTSVAE